MRPILAIAVAFIFIINIPVETKGMDNYDMLIIAPSKYMGQLEKFVEYKNNHGVKTIAVSLNDIFEGKYFKCNGRDEQEKIKFFIKNCYDTWHIKYVLLVGSYKDLPVRYAYLNDRSSTWEWERKFISDLYYADIYDSNGSFSSWDTNNNGFYAEFEHEIDGRKYTDKVDLSPEVAIGRLACRNARELRNAISKIESYESSSMPDRILLAGGDSYPNDPCGNIAEGIYLDEEIGKVMSSFQQIKLYPPENAMEINDAINSGVAFAVMEGAGAQHLWGTHEKDSEKWIYYYGFNIKLLRNRYYPIVLTSGARLAKFDENRECFNWMFVAARHGGVASIGSTGLCWTAHGKNVSEFYLGNLHVRLFQEYEKADTIGDMWKNAIISYLKAFKWNGSTEKAFHMKAAEELELFGDPSMKLNKMNKACSIAGRVLYVGGSGPGNYSTIQDAINDARDGDTIIVLKGVYEENVVANKSLTIEGRDAVLKGTFFIMKNATIKGFSIYNENKAIKCMASHVKIEQNDIEAYYGIVAEDSSCLKVEDNVFHSRYAIYVKNSSYSKFDGNSVNDGWYGVWAENCPYMSIQNNNFSHNRWYTVWLAYSDGSNVENNSFYMNWYSIFLYHSNNCIVRENEIVHNEHGPQIVVSCNNIIENNDIEHNEHYGIYAGNRSLNNRFIANNIIDNAYNARDDGKNEWSKNYWSDYIGLRIKLLAVLGFPYHVGKFNFDWRPALMPYS